MEYLFDKIINIITDPNQKTEDLRIIDRSIILMNDMTILAMLNKDNIIYDNINSIDPEKKIELNIDLYDYNGIVVIERSKGIYSIIVKIMYDNEIKYISSVINIHTKKQALIWAKYIKKAYEIYQYMYGMKIHPCQISVHATQEEIKQAFNNI